MKDRDALNNTKTAFLSFPTPAVPLKCCFVHVHVPTSGPPWAFRSCAKMASDRPDVSKRTLLTSSFPVGLWELWIQNCQSFASGFLSQSCLMSDFGRSILRGLLAYFTSHIYQGLGIVFWTQAGRSLKKTSHGRQHMLLQSFFLLSPEDRKSLVIIKGGPRLTAATFSTSAHLR